MFPTPYLKDSPEKIDLHEFYNQITSQIPVTALKKSLIGINIPSALVTVIILRLPKMTKKELGIAVMSEAKRRIVPAPDAASIFKYMVLDEVTVSKDNIRMYDMLVVKTQEDYSKEIVKLFKMFGGIHPSFISPTCYTIVNLFPPEHEIYQKDTAFVDIGYDSINMTIAKKGKLYFYRNIKLGLKDAVSHIAMTLNIPIGEMEEVIRDKGIPEVQIDIGDKVRLAEEIMRQKYEFSLKPTPQDINLLELRMLWNTEIERIINEVRRTLIYYKEHTGGGRVDNILFLGGGISIKGFFSAVAKGIGGERQAVMPFTNMDISVDEKQVKYVKELFSLFVPAVSIALSLPLAVKTQATIDFLPLELKRQKLIVRRQIIFIIIGVVLFAFVFLFWLKFLLEKQVLKDSVSSLDFELNRKKVFTEKLNEIKKEKLSLGERMQDVQNIMAKRTDAPAILDELVNFTPGKVYLTNVNIYRKGKASGSPEASLSGSSSMQLSPQQDQAAAPIAQEQQTNFPGQQTRGQEEGYSISITAGCFADYEEAQEFAKMFKNKLEKSSYFVNVTLVSPELEKITPLINGPVSVSLTEPKVREFSLNADLIQTQ